MIYFYVNKFIRLMNKYRIISFDFAKTAVFVSVVLFVSILYLIVVHGETVTTQVTVGNSAPAFTAGPAESVASYSSAPTNEGSSITFQATATDSNSEDYYLAICKTNSITDVESGAPTCGGGNWCISTATTSGNQASCNYTTVGGDAESNAWFAFVCDGNSSSASCSASSSGTGDSGSPFAVNHDPTFSAVSDNGGAGVDSGADPGGTMTFTATASDGDTDGVSDTVKLVVCADTSGATFSGCSGTQLCASTSVASNPSCAYNYASVLPDDTLNYYAYVFDSHSFASASNYRTGSYIINNVSPSVTFGTLNGSADISLTELSTKNVVITATVTDSNSCQDLSTVETSLYRSAITYAGCTSNAQDDNNHCYAQVSCSVSGASCTGNTDASADYTCTVAVQYHADPTDAGTEYPAQNWLATVNAIDDDAASNNDEVGTGVEVEGLTALDVTSAINYGSLDVGQKNDPLDQTTTVTATGNVGLDQFLSGTGLTDVDTIAVNYQKYALAVSTAYSSGVSLSGTPTESELNCLKTTITGTPETKNTWWGIEIPSGISPGTYSGSNTVTAFMGEIVNW